INNYARGTGGGVLFWENAQGRFYNNTVVDNTATWAGKGHNITIQETGELSVYNNIIWSFSASPSSEFDFYKTDAEKVRIFNNILMAPFGPEVQVTAFNNYYVEPVFQHGSYELVDSSPGIGWGIDTLEVEGTLYFAPSTDMAGNPRPHPADSFVDLGAYESPYSGNLVYIPDVNLLKALINKGVDTSGDGRISFPEAEAVTSIDVHSKNIADMTGIEAFINIDSFDCSYNQLTALDISENPALINLKCRSNRLTSLDVSKNTALVALDCRTNLLTSLDVSNNTALKNLDCSSNQMTSLDLSRNTVLESINLKNIPTLNEVCVWILPFPPANVYAETIDSPNICFDTICNGTCDETGIDEKVTTGISIYPNPAYNLLTIETEKSGPHDIEITSLNGQLIYSATMEGDTHLIDMTPFSKGVYLIRIRTKEFVTIRKLIKQ
ncbi:MAG: T9SS type A sorting domain-containing protein, partial [Bacteroidales bacterium]|nr:T9SS type A sorting domain-containing protein [Bacteroidales bacterium]